MLNRSVDSSWCWSVDIPLSVLCKRTNAIMITCTVQPKSKHCYFALKAWMNAGTDYYTFSRSLTAPMKTVAAFNALLPYTHKYKATRACVSFSFAGCYCGSKKWRRLRRLAFFLEKTEASVEEFV